MAIEVHPQRRHTIAHKGGICVVCSQGFDAGDEIRFDAGEQGWAHREC